MILILLFCLTPFKADKVEIIKDDGESVVHLLGNVVIEDENAKIVCSEASLHESKDFVILKDDVRIIDKNGEIRSGFAVYYFKKKKGYLRDSVSLLTENEIISADSLYYDGVEAHLEMFGHVKIEDEKNSLVAHGERGWYNLKQDVGYLVEKAELSIIREDKDPMKITAREFKLETATDEFSCFDSVVIIIDSITIYCDTFSYNLKSENGTMVRPLVVQKNNELRGETGAFSMKEKEIESFIVHNGWSKYYTEEGSENIVEGEKVSIVFKKGKASKIFVDGKPSGVLTLKRKKEDAGDQ